MASRREFARKVAATVATAASVGLAGCQHPDPPEWSMDRGDPQHTASIDTHVSVPLQERWSVSLRAEILGSPVGGHDNVLVPAGSKLYALHTRDGSTTWSYDAGVTVHAAPTAVTENNGQDEFIFVSSMDGVVHSVDPSDGSNRWTSPAANAGTHHSATNYADGQIFQVYQDGPDSSALRAIDGQSGSVNWDRSLGTVTPVTPMYANGNVHVGVPGPGKIYRAFDAQTGQPQWDVTKQSGRHVGCFNSGALDADVSGGNPDRIYLSTEYAYLSAHDAGSGSQQWSTFKQVKERIHGFALTQGRSSNTLVAGSRGSLFGIDPATGQQQWRYNHGFNPRHSNTGQTPRPAIYGDRVFQVVDGSKLVAVSLSNGQEQWKQSLSGSSTHSSPLVGGQTVYVGDSAGKVYAFSP